MSSEIFNGKPGEESGSLGDWRVSYGVDPFLPDLPDNIKIIGGEAPKLPDLKEVVIPLFKELDAAIEKAGQDEQYEALVNFYLPLMSFLYSLVLLILDKILDFMKISEDFGEEFMLFFFWIGEFTHQIELTLFKMGEIAGGKVDFKEAFFNSMEEYEFNPSFWNSIRLIYVAELMTTLLSTENHVGDPAFFIDLDDRSKHTFSSLPKSFRREETNDLTAVSAYGNSLFVLPGFMGLDLEARAKLWDYILVEKAIYDNPSIDHSSRIFVFEEIFKIIEEQFLAQEAQGEGEKLKHLDLCGGTGIFSKWVKDKNPEIDSIMIDNAPGAVGKAQEKEVEAYVGNAEVDLEIDGKLIIDHFDVITVVFATHWISPNSFEYILKALKPGGVVCANVYPIHEERAKFLATKLEGFGFVSVGYEKVGAGGGESQYILSARKPAV